MQSPTIAPGVAADNGSITSSADEDSVTRRVVAQIRAEMAVSRPRISQQELADRLGVHRETVGRLLNGRTSLTLDTVQSIAAALDVPVRRLLDAA